MIKIMSVPLAIKLSKDAIPRENKLRCIAYKSQTVLFIKTIINVINDTPLVEPVINIE